MDTCCGVKLKNSLLTISLLYSEICCSFLLCERENERTRGGGILPSLVSRREGRKKNSKFLAYITMLLIGTKSVNASFRRIFSFQHPLGAPAAAAAAAALYMK